MPDGKKNLLLVTAGFPYGEWERGFLTTEFLQLCRNFSVTVLSVGREDPLLYPVENVVRLERYLYPQKLPSVATMLQYLTVPDVVRECLRAAWSAPHKKVLSRLHLINAYYFQAEQIADKMEQLIREQEIDIVYTYWATEPAVAACMLKKKYPQLRFVTRFHGHDLYRERKGCFLPAQWAWSITSTIGAAAKRRSCIIWAAGKRPSATITPVMCCGSSAAPI